MNIRNVLSLFDGLGGARLALEKAGFEIDRYYASEIDEYATAVTQYNFPDTIQLGDITKIKAEDLPTIDLLIGGSPCQDLSIAKKGREGLKGSRSGLFWEYVMLLEELKPKWFVLENVASMPKKAKQVITDTLGVEPIMINSALVSAQNRKRLYWTNIPNVEQPKDKGILLKDILETGVVDRDKSYCLDANYFKGCNLDSYFNKSRRQVVFQDKLSPNSGGTGYKTGLYVVAQRCRDGENAGKTEQKIETSYSEKANVLTSVQKDSMVLKVPEATKKGYTEIEPGECFDGTQPKSKTRRGRKMGEKSNALTCNHNFMHFSEEYIIRKLTPRECERLQTVPDDYTLVPHPKFKNRMMSNTQRYKMLGNGFTVDVIAHILSFIR